MKDSKNLRYLDKRLGSVICRIFSFIHLLRVGRKNRPIKNILVIELFEMGAAIMTYPSLMYIQEKNPGVNIYSLTLKTMKESWNMLGIIQSHNIFAVEEKSLFHFSKSLFKHILQLRKKDIDLIIDYELFMRIPAVISFLIKSRYRAGFFRYQYEGLYRGNFYDYKCAFNQNSHIAKNFLALTKTAIGKEEEYPNYKNSINSSELFMPKYTPRPDLKKGIEEKIKGKYENYKTNKLILISHDVGENLSIRNYPKHMLAEVIQMLLENYKDYLILLVGTKADRPSGSWIEMRVNDTRCINFSGETPTLPEFFELINMGELLITNDNGPEHFASITGTKTLALFSTDSPYIYGPIGNAVILYEFFQCSPCISALNQKNSKCTNNLCLQAMSPERIFDSAVKMIEGKVKYGTINGEIPYY